MGKLDGARRSNEVDKGACLNIGGTQRARLCSCFWYASVVPGMHPTVDPEF